jgi:hypothetical protein
VTPERTQQLSAKLQEAGAKLHNRDALPVVVIGYHGDGKRGYYTVDWCGRDNPSLEETHQLLSAMLEQVAGQLGVT